MRQDTEQHAAVTQMPFQTKMFHLSFVHLKRIKTIHDTILVTDYMIKHDKHELGMLCPFKMEPSQCSGTLKDSVSEPLQT